MARKTVLRGILRHMIIGAQLELSFNGSDRVKAWGDFALNSDLPSRSQRAKERAESIFPCMTSIRL